jgi:hypothetical protein
MDRGTFAVAVSCIDGRVHEPLLAWVRERTGVDHVDLVTEPGPDAALADCPTGACDAIRARLSVSLQAHHPNAVVIAGHDDCAANPVDPATHRLHIAAAVHELRSWDHTVPVTGVWVRADGTVEEVAAEPGRSTEEIRGGV